MSDTKRCDTCRIDKSPSEFNRNRSKRDGLNSICRECSQKRSRRYYAENRVKHLRVVLVIKRARIAANRVLVRAYLSQHPCVDCGEGDPIVLEFDHVRGQKRTDISKLVAAGFSEKTILAEIGKCDVRCANCHRRVTAARRVRNSISECSPFKGEVVGETPTAPTIQ